MIDNNTQFFKTQPEKTISERDELVEEVVRYFIEGKGL